MSAIANRLISSYLSSDGNTELNATVFAFVLNSFLLNHVSASQALDFVNDHITKSGGAPLNSEEIDNIVSIAVTYNGASVQAQNVFRDYVVSYSQMLQDFNLVPFDVAGWDAVMGL